MTMCLIFGEEMMWIICVFEPQSGKPDMQKDKFYDKLVASTKCKIALVEVAWCLMHADDQMQGIYQVIKQMALRSTIYGIVPHAC